jgi:hypothetical protein
MSPVEIDWNAEAERLRKIEQQLEKMQRRFGRADNDLDWKYVIAEQRERLLLLADQLQHNVDWRPYYAAKRNTAIEQRFRHPPKTRPLD